MAPFNSCAHWCPWVVLGHSPTVPIKSNGAAALLLANSSKLLGHVWSCWQQKKMHLWWTGFQKKPYSDHDENLTGHDNIVQTCPGNRHILCVWLGSVISLDSREMTELYSAHVVILMSGPCITIIIIISLGPSMWQGHDCDHHEWSDIQCPSSLTSSIHGPDTNSHLDVGVVQAGLPHPDASSQVRS